MKFSHQQIILNRYRVTHALGSGTMGEVYLARQIALDRDVAIKVLRDAQSEEALKRFEQEAHIMAQLRHPNVVNILDYGILADQSPCIVMEYIDGDSLGDVLKTRGALPWREAVEIIAGMARGLSELHERNFVHRDLKPDNVLLSRTTPREVKMLDFGVARDLARDNKLTRAGALVGTPAYMSPEQLFGEKASPRSDLYAIGVMLYELVTGKLPNDPKGMKDLRKRLTAPIQPPVAPEHHEPLPDALTQLLLEDLLPADALERIPSARQLIDKLGALFERANLGGENSTQVWDNTPESMLEQTTAAEDLHDSSTHLKPPFTFTPNRTPVRTQNASLETE